MNILEFMAEGRLCCLQFGTVMNKALLNILVRVLRCMNPLIAGNSGPSGRYVCTFSRHCRTVSRKVVPGYTPESFSRCASSPTLVIVFKVPPGLVGV